MTAEKDKEPGKLPEKENEISIDRPGSWKGNLPGRNPVLGLETIRNTMNQLVADIFYQAENVPFDAPWQPKLNMYADGDELCIDIELPGVDKENINIHATSDLLIVQGTTGGPPALPRGQYFAHERFSGKFSRSVPLPYKVLADKIKAQLREGVLRITVPIKPGQPAIGKKVEIE